MKISVDYNIWASLQHLGMESDNSVMDESMDKQKIDVLNKMIKKHLPVGPDGTNVLNSLKGIIDDEQLDD